MNTVQPIRDVAQIEAMKAELKKSGTRDYLLFMMGINVGLRISDMLKLKVSDVRNKTHLIVKEEKTGKTRTVKIRTATREIINEYILNMGEDEWLFPSRKGDKPITRVQAYRILNAAGRKAGIETEIGTHTLRKTFGYHLYKKTNDIALVQEQLNHSSSVITLRYIGESQERIDEIMDDFEL